jgi:hypothetical protein
MTRIGFAVGHCQVDARSPNLAQFAFAAEPHRNPWGLARRCFRQLDNAAGSSVLIQLEARRTSSGRDMRLCAAASTAANAGLL